MKNRWLWAATLLLVAAATTFSATRINLATQVRGILGETNGGTAQNTYALGDILYSDAADSLAKLPGNITTTKRFLTQTGTGAVSAAPSWGDVLDADIPGTIARDSELHGQSHVLADTAGLGADHTTSGLTARQVLIATAPTTALFRALVDADIPNTITLDNITQITTRPITSLTGVATKSQLPSSVAYEDEANTFTASLNTFLESGTAITPASSTVVLVQNSAAVGTNAALAIISGTSGRAILNLGDTASEGVGRIDYDNLINEMVFFTGGVERARFESSGLNVTGVVSLGSAADVAIRRVTTDKIGPGIDDEWRLQGTTGTIDILSTVVTGDTNPRFILEAGGLMEWGPGNAVLDTNLFRSAANTLKTDDNFIVGAVLETTDDGTERILLINRDFGDPKTGIIRIRGDLVGRFLELKWSGSANAAFITNNGLGNLNIQNLFSGGDIAFSTVGTGDFTFSNGNVGIGTTSLVNKFTVQKGTLGSATTFSSVPTINIIGDEITVRTDATLQQILYLHQPNTFTNSKGSAFGIGLSFWQDPGNNFPRTRVDFQTTGRTTDSVQAANTIMSLRDDGNVGIGTASPGRPLHVVSSFDVVARFESTDSFSSISIRDSNTTAGDQVLLVAVGDDMRFRTLNTDRMTILSGGNVGIGTTSPGAGLEINNNNTLQYWISTDDQSRLSLVVDTAVNPDLFIFNATRLGAGDLVALDIRAQDFLVFTTNGLERIRIESGGDVGIGLANPSANLHVVGDFKIGSSGAGITRHLSKTFVMDFGAILANDCDSISGPLSNVVVGDTVAIGIPISAAVGDLSFTGLVFSAGNIVIVACNVDTATSPNPPSATFRVDVWQH